MNDLYKGKLFIAFKAFSQQCLCLEGILAFNCLCLKELIVQALLGSAPNRRKLRRALAKYVSLRRFEQMSTHQALQGLQLSQLPFLWPNRRRGNF